MNSLAVRGWLLLAAVLALAYGGWIAYRVEREQPSSTVRAVTALEPGRPIGDFTLTDQSGQLFDTADLHGKVWVASFFFASCPGPCRQMNQSLAALAGQVPADVSFVSVTCDPDTDTPDTLTRYAKLFDADPERWKFLTGEMRDLKHVGRDIFQVALEKGTHYEKGFVVDRSGVVRGRFSLLDPDEVAKMKQLIIDLDGQSATDPRGHEDTQQPTDRARGETSASVRRFGTLSGFLSARLY